MKARPRTSLPPPKLPPALPPDSQHRRDEHHGDEHRPGLFVWISVIAGLLILFLLLLMLRLSSGAGSSGSDRGNGQQGAIASSSGVSTEKLQGDDGNSTAQPISSESDAEPQVGAQAADATPAEPSTGSSPDETPSEISGESSTAAEPSRTASPESLDSDMEHSEAESVADANADSDALQTQGPTLPDLRLPGSEGNWRVAGREPGAVEAAGGSAESEAAVEAALNWIAKHQLSDGSWDFDHTIGPGDHRDSPDPGTLGKANLGATGLALLPFLGAGNTHQSGKYQEVVSRGLNYLISQQGQGRYPRSFYDAGNMYSHAICTLALAESFALTQDPQFARPTEAALEFIVEAQDPEGGGWRYTPRTPGDVSVTGWQLMAIRSSELGGLVVPAITLQKARRFLDSMQGPNGGYGYSLPGAEPTMTAVGVLCRMYDGAKPSDPLVLRGVGLLSQWGPSVSTIDHQQDVDLYLDYHATQVMRHVGGSGWQRWNDQVRDRLVNSQVREGNAAGSWHFRHVHAISGGRLYSTSLACLTLEVYYRHLALFDSRDTWNP